MAALGAAWRAVRDQFRVAGLPTPELDARLLAQKAFSLDALTLMARERELAAPAGLERLKSLADRRLGGEPVARILGEWEFYGLRFALSPATLVPRPETEALVDLGIEILGGKVAPRLLDLGTGTGCIPISLLVHLPQARGVAIDLSAEAIETGKGNAARHQIADRLSFREGSWFEPLQDDERFDLIVSNPPYIESTFIDRLMAEVRDHDPILALDGGPDGFDAYRIIAAGAARHLRDGGVLALEIGAGQGQAVKTLLEQAGFVGVRINPDLAGLDRVVFAHQL